MYLVAHLCGGSDCAVELEAGGVGLQAEGEEGVLLLHQLGEGGGAETGKNPV